VKERGVGFRLYEAECLHAAKVLCAVHAGPRIDSGVFGNPVPIIESRVTSSASAS
jgi:hypothetical protein